MLAQVIFHGADTRAARAEIDRAFELAPGNPIPRELSGDIYDREGLLNLAVGEWETAVAAAAGGGAAFAEVFREEMRLEIPEFEDRWRRSLR